MRLAKYPNLISDALHPNPPSIPRLFPAAHSVSRTAMNVSWGTLLHWSTLWLVLDRKKLKSLLIGWMATGYYY